MSRRVERNHQNMRNDIRKHSMDRPGTYQIIVPGVLDANNLDWNGGMIVKPDNDRAGAPITILTITVDQAGLQGLLRYLYSLGLPLISVLYLTFEEKPKTGETKTSFQADKGQD